METAGADVAVPTRQPPRLTVETVVAALVGSLSFLIAVRPALDNDLWFHLRTADWMLDHHRWVGVDPFTHTRSGVVRVQTDWLGQLALHGAWRVAGLAGIAVLVAAVLGGAMVLLYRVLDGPVRVRAGVCLLVAGASSIFWSARPQTFTFLGMIAVIGLTRTWRRQPGSWSIAWLVPLFLVWVNTHGGVVYGFLLVAGTLAGEVGNRLVADQGRSLGVTPLPVAALRRLALVVAGCLAVMVVNPSGIRVYGLPFHQVASAGQYVQEVQPPSITDPIALPFFLLAIVALAALVCSRRALNLVDVVLVLCTLAFALKFTRSIPFFAVAAAPLIAGQLADMVTDRDPAWRPSARAPGGLVAVLLCTVLAAAGLTAVRLDHDRVAALEAESYPVGAVDWIEAEHPPHELWNTFDWGGFLHWQLPSYRVSVDGRTDVYDDYLDVYASVTAAEPGWEDELDREGIGTVLIDTGSPLDTALRSDHDWHLAYEDPVAVVFVRA